MTIIGRGNVRITVNADVPALENYDTTNGNERIVISDFEIVAARNDPSTYYSNVIHFVKTKFCVIEKCTIKVIRANTGSTGICLEGSSAPVYAEGNTITECTIYGDSTNALYFGIRLDQYCKGNMLTGNTMYYCKECCWVTNHSINNVISNNVFRNSENAGGSFGGLYIYNESNLNVITGNQCIDNIMGISEVPTSALFRGMFVLPKLSDIILEKEHSHELYCC